MLIPGQPEAAVGAPVDQWTEARLGHPAERIHAGGGFAYDLTFADLARQETRLIASNAARWIEYPTGHLDLGNRDWSLPLVVRPLVLGTLTVLTVLGLRRSRRARPALAARTVAAGAVQPESPAPA